tara:strand:+ start:65 stop:775 length:711 start_codon:yes stop_codon:yes gene_type:complete
MESNSDLNSSNTVVKGGGFSTATKKWGSQSIYIPDGNTTTYITSNGIDLSGGAVDGDYTLSVWFYLTALRNSGIQPVMMVNSGNDVDANGAITVASPSSGYIDAHGGSSADRMFGKGRSNSVSIDSGYDSGTTIAAGSWKHGLHVLDTTANTYKQYLNGTLIKTTSSASTTGSQPVGLADSSDVDYLLGHEPDAFNPYGGFDGGQSIVGYIDQARIFNRVLDSTEVGYVYNEQLIS